ncbi:YcxB family protein [Mariniblastus fucicola]|nr:YcxB family protein [Mariniblastus fucicola]
MNFQFEYNEEERKRVDRLNTSRVVGPWMFAVLWCCCFIPTAFCLIWLQMWSVVVAGTVLVLMASFVPAFSRLRGTTRHEFPRSIEVTPVGKREKCGDTTTFVKWNSIDEVIETKHDFLFSRNQRFSLLPKRVVEEARCQSLRDQIAAWRNHPAESTEPIDMYRRLLEPANSQNSQSWQFELTREDLLVAAKSTSIRPIHDPTFSFKDVESVNRTGHWYAVLIFAVIFIVAVVLLFASLPPNRLDWPSMLVFICLNPFVLLFVVGFWIRRQRITGVPRFRPETYRVRLFEGGWAIGNEDLAAFNGWNERSRFYVAPEFIGIRTDLALIHVMPIRGFGNKDGVWQFLDRAIRLKKNWLDRKSNDETDTQITNDVDNGEEPDQPVNPYRSPSVKSR